MKHKDTRINTGGMFRCCVDTLNTIDLDTEFEDGTVLDCKHEKEGNQALILENGIWRWNEASSKFRFSE